MKVRDAMSSDVISVRTDAPFRSIVTLLCDNAVSGLPVVDGDGHVLGIVSQGDVVVKGHRSHPVNVHAPFTQADDPREHRRRADALTAGALMTTPAVTVAADEDLRVAARLMTLHGVRRIPVTSRGKLVGIITRGDMTKVFLRSDEDIAREICEEILPHKLLDDVPNIDVTVREGVVFLRGTVGTRSTAKTIAFHADRLDGVTRVVNELAYELDDLEPLHVAPPAIGPLEQVL